MSSVVGMTIAYILMCAFNIGMWISAKDDSWIIWTILWGVSFIAAIIFVIKVKKELRS